MLLIYQHYKQKYSKRLWKSRSLRTIRKVYRHFYARLCQLVTTVHLAVVDQLPLCLYLAYEVTYAPRAIAMGLLGTMKCLIALAIRVVRLRPTTMRDWILRATMKAHPDYASNVAHIRTCHISSCRRLSTRIWKADEDSNPHSIDAKVRSVGEALIREASKGYNLFDVQKSNGSVLGSSEIHDPIDTPQQPSGQMQDAEAFRLIDVDYYINMPQVMGYFKPMYIYTMVPHYANFSDGAHSYYVDTKHKVHWSAHCGYTAAHEIWNYGPDFITTSAGHWYWPKATCVYKVMKFSLIRSRAVIILVPWYYVPWYCYYFTSCLYRTMDNGTATLQRVKFVNKGSKHQWIAYRLKTPTGEYVNIAAANQNSASIQVPQERFSLCIDHARIASGNTVPEHTVTRVVDDSEHDMILLTTYAKEHNLYNHQLDTIHLGVGLFEPKVGKFGAECKCDAHDKVCDREPDSNPMICDKHIGSKEIKPSVTVSGSSVMLPIPRANPSVCAIERTKAGATTSQRERINVPQHDAHARFNPIVMAKFNDFVKYLMERLPKHEPLTLEQVLERVAPKYKDATREAWPREIGPHCRMIDQFIKSEVYVERKDARLISPLHIDVQSKLYAYTYALQDALHSVPWFAFGRPLGELANHISEMSKNKHYAIETDFSRFDGTITTGMRQLELLIYQAYFPTHKEHVTELHGYTYNLIARSHQGAKTNTGSSRCSGAADTCLMNSLMNAYVAYLTFNDKFDGLGVVGGDDGLFFTNRQTDSVAFQRNAANCGFKIKCVVKDLYSKDCTYTFLARTFVPGSPNSCCDVLRTLTKVHILGRAGIPAKELPARRYSKLFSLLQNDEGTPLVGDVLKDALSKIPIEHRKLVVDDTKTFWQLEQIRMGGPWPNQMEPWMEHYVGQKIRVVKTIDGLRVEVCPPRLGAH